MREDQCVCVGKLEGRSEKPEQKQGWAHEFPKMRSGGVRISPDGCPTLTLSPSSNFFGRVTISEPSLPAHPKLQEHAEAYAGGRHSGPPASGPARPFPAPFIDRRTCHSQLRIHEQRCRNSMCVVFFHCQYLVPFGSLPTCPSLIELGYTWC